MSWWRPPGHFSGPLLANPHFREVFLSRVREIVDKVYTEQRYVPMIDDLVRRLTRDGSGEQLARDGEFLKAHLRGRRQFLLRQKELQGQ